MRRRYACPSDAPICCGTGVTQVCMTSAATCCNGYSCPLDHPYCCGSRVPTGAGTIFCSSSSSGSGSSSSSNSQPSSSCDCSCYSFPNSMLKTYYATCTRSAPDINNLLQYCCIAAADGSVPDCCHPTAAQAGAFQTGYCCNWRQLTGGWVDGCILEEGGDFSSAAANIEIREVLTSFELIK